MIQIERIGERRKIGSGGGEAVGGRGIGGGGVGDRFGIGGNPRGRTVSDMVVSVVIAREIDVIWRRELFLRD